MMAKYWLIGATVISMAGCDKPSAQTAKSAVEPAPKAETSNWRYATGALDSDCAHSGKNPDGSYEFMVPCPASFASPDGQWRMVMGEENAEGLAPVSLQRRDGSQFAVIEELSDGMPFTLFWSPRPNWFLVNHHVGSFMRRPEVYEITSAEVVRHPELTVEGFNQARRISPCLVKRKWDTVTGLALGWSDDGRKVAWLFSPRTDACVGMDHSGPIPKDKSPKSFWMISEAESGQVLSGSIRILADDAPSDVPTDSEYREFSRGR